MNTAAPAGGSTVSLSSNNPALTLPGSITVAAGAATGTFNATAAASIPSNQSATVTATLGASAKTATFSLVAPVQISALGCSPTTLGPSAASTCTVTLTQTAPAGGSTVGLSSNNPALTLPGSITVAAGAATGTFSATAAASIPSNQSATVTATLGASAKTATFSLVAPVQISALGCSPTTLGPSAASTCTVTLTQTAPAGGSTVGLSSNNPALTLPGSITVAAGAATGAFSATAAASISTNQSATVTATLGTSSQATTFSLVAPVQISALGCSPTTLGPGAASTCTITLTQSAPAGGSTIGLTSNNPVLALPALITVSPGSTSSTFSATAAASIPGNQSATLTATLSASSQTATFSLVAPAQVSALGCSPTGVMSGASVTCTVTLSQPAQTDTTVSLSSNSTLITIPPTVTIPAGNSSAGATANIGTIAADTAAVITATLNASSQNASLTLWSTPTLSSLSCAPTKLPVGASSSCSVTLSKAAGDVTVQIGSVNPALGVPASLTVPRGSLNSVFTVTAQSPAAGWLLVKAALNGTSKSLVFIISGTSTTSVSGTSSPTSSIDPSAPRVKSISCSPNALRIGAHGICQIALDAVTDSSTAELQLASSSESVTLPATITTRPGQSSIEFQIDSILPTQDQGATITAQLGSDVVQDIVSLDSSRGGPLTVPSRVFAKYGTEVHFRVSSSDPSATLSAAGLPPGALFDSVSGEFVWTPGDSQPGSYDIAITALNPAGGQVTEHSILDVDSGIPVVTSVVNAASRSRDVACSPGAIASLEGRWLVEGSAASDPSGSSMQLSGTVVSVNGNVVPILSASPTRVDFLCPNAAPGTTLEIAAQTLSAIAQPVQTISRQIAPGIFSIDGTGTGQGMILHIGTTKMVMLPNYRYPSQPAQSGDSIAIYATGIDATADVSVQISGIEVTPQFAIPVSGLVGVYQLSVIVPTGTVPRDTVISFTEKTPNGLAVSSNEVKIATEGSPK